MDEELTSICDKLSTLAETNDEVQARVDDLCYEQFGDDKSTSHINNQGIHSQFEDLAGCWGLEEAVKVAKDLLLEMTTCDLSNDWRKHDGKHAQNLGD